MKKAMQAILLVACVMGFTAGLMVMAADAADREMSWNDARFCRTYGHEINAYAVRHGQEKPCGDVH